MKRGLRVLLFALLLQIAGYPFVAGTLGKAFFVLLSTAIMIAGAFAGSRTRHDLALALLLAMPATITRWSDVFAPTRAMLLTAEVTTMAFYTYTAVLVFQRVLAAEEVGPDEIYGGLSVYILMGIIWGIAYALLESMVPNSFEVEHETSMIGALTYYSFVTLMTVGFGDVRPLSPAARSLSVFEALAGTFFMAVFIARLVGLARIGRR